MTQDSEVLAIFLQEARELIAELEAGLMVMAKGQAPSECLHGVFRAAHTIKGSSSAAELPAIASFTHRLENILDLARNGRLDASGAVAERLLAGCDCLSSMAEMAEAGTLSEAWLLAEPAKSLLQEYDLLCQGHSQQTPKAAQNEYPGAAPAAQTAALWHILVQFGNGVFLQGMDPLAFLRHLQTLGKILEISTLESKLPEPADFDPEQCYLGFELLFESGATQSQIEQVFDFVRDDCFLRILPAESQASEFKRLIDDCAAENLKIGEMLLLCNALSRRELDEALSIQKERAANPGHTPPLLGSILLEQKSVSPEILQAACQKQEKQLEKKTADARLLRVEAQKIDSLIDLIGELVIAGAGARVQTESGDRTGARETVLRIQSLVEELRDCALQMRMVQIGETFNRFHRVVRDLNKDLGKSIELHVQGSETELDKSVVEKIADPLMHLVRNACDHGIETPAERQSNGKSPAGTLRLCASHEAGNIQITVSDDGRGLDLEKIRAKAAASGLIDPAAALSDHALANLIFEPGFSTAEQVTSLSGRGVGLDVVKKNIQALRGAVEVRPGENGGTVFCLRLPLTLAIIDGFLVACGGASYAIPLEDVVECVEAPASGLQAGYCELRGKPLPLLRLRDLFAIPGPAPKRSNIVVVSCGGARAGIVVDELLGEFQAVIKPLGPLFAKVPGVSGSTILGSGSVALLLDVPGLVSRAQTL